MTLTLAQAEDLATRTLAAIDHIEQKVTDAGLPLDAILDRHTTDRERIISDLDGLRACWWKQSSLIPGMEGHAARYFVGLIRTAALYGVEA